MSAILFLQEAVQIAIPQWIGWTGAGVILTGSFAIHRMISSKFDTKLDKSVFEEHKEADKQAHESINDTMKRIDDNVKMLVEHHINKK